MEEKKEVKTFVVNYICDECGKGKMVPTAGIYLTSNPPQWPHECTHCNNTKTFRICYPYHHFRPDTFTESANKFGLALNKLWTVIKEETIGRFRKDNKTV